MIMSAINFADSCGLTYVHTPFTLIEHGDRPMLEWPSPGKHYSISVRGKRVAALTGMRL